MSATPKKKSAKSAAAKPPAAAKQKSARSGKASAAAQPLTVEELLDRSRKIAGIIERLDESAAIEEAARRCVTAGRPDLAASLAQGLRAELRAPALAIAAAAGAGSVDAAIDAFMESAARDPRSRPLWAARAAEALALVGAGGRAAPLALLVDAVIDEAFAGEPAWDESAWGKSNRFTALVPLLRAQLANGAAKPVRRTLDRWLREDPESLGEVLQNASPLLWIAPDEPTTTLALINAIEDGSRHMALTRGDGVRACAAWAREHLDTLIALEPHSAASLGKYLIAAGRDVDARHVLAPRPGEEEPLASTLVEHHLLLGEIEAARQLARDTERWLEPTELTRSRILLGVESVAQARERLRQLDPRTGGSVMAQVRALIFLAELALERGEHAELDPILSAIDGLLASKKRTHYDVGVEASTRSQLAGLRLRIVAAQGDRAAVAAALEADLADLPRLHAHARADQKNDVTRSLVCRAIHHGQPELALKSAKKITPADRHLVARQVATAFLPADPGGALAALDALAGDRADSMLLARPPDGTGAGVQLLPLLWSAVLSPAAARGAP